jgi:hypothetical protein
VDIGPSAKTFNNFASEFCDRGRPEEGSSSRNFANSSTSSRLWSISRVTNTAALIQRAAEGGIVTPRANATFRAAVAVHVSELWGDPDGHRAETAASTADRSIIEAAR